MGEFAEQNAGHAAETGAVSRDLAQDVMADTRTKLAELGKKGLDQLLTDPPFLGRVRVAYEGGELQREEYVAALGMIAHANRQKGEGLPQPRRTAMERGKFVREELSDTQRTWRAAVQLLRSFENRPRNPQEYSPGEWQERMRVADEAHEWLRRLEATKESELALAQEPEAAGEEILGHVVPFEVLPHAEGTSTERERLGPFAELLDSGRLDLDRLERLFQYRDRYHGDIYVSKFGRPGGTEEHVVAIPRDRERLEEDNSRFDFTYAIVVFSKEDAEGKLRKFAIADKVTKDATQLRESNEGSFRERVASGAIYVFEEEEGSPLTWQAVLSQTKPLAQKLGAKKFVHRGEYEERIERFLGNTGARSS